ncbi:class I adenylate-forming enzyme family protein [Porticoccaceae bacterium]|jgi:long-chain acyl-CoA synthetase|nr:acyl--CoA ligase [Porticoccaceae bacterium]MBT6318850.1 acyl--CoA ligase [Porticoccaceae bacterium]MBT7259025.1 acyl--CoA ligase [Porticoccaceae bacterium]MDA8903757.1 acyl--CoA ligase [Porticoccaceae bacterium]MDA8920127.1 acyl--CoA ligase [Porticoccaceae bacterium]
MNRQQVLAAITAPGQPLEMVEMDVYGSSCRGYKNAPASLRDLFEQNLTDETFIVFDQERYTFRDIWAHSSAIGQGLVSDYGIQKGDCVAICMRNFPEWIMAFQAITSIGAIAVGMNSLWQAEEIDYGLQDSGCKLLIADQERIDLVVKAEIQLSCETLLVRGDQTTDLPRWEDLQEKFAGNLMPTAEIAPIDDAIIFFTSGSTGRPKGVVSSNLAIMSALLSWEVAITGWILLRGEAPAPPEHQPAGLLAVPLFHVTGCHAIFLMAFRNQTKLVLMRKWNPQLAAQLVEQEKISSFTAPPAMTADLIYSAQQGGHDLSSLVMVGGGGAARSPEQVRGIDAVFENAMPNTGWGMTETNAIGTAIAGGNYLERPGSSGQPAAVLDIRIVDEEDNERPKGERGEVQIRGTSMFRGYWNNPEATANSLVDGWFKTGDIGYMDEEDYLFIVDRIKDMVIRGGENIGCGEVEAALLEHPLIREAAVYSVPDQRLGEEVGATIYSEGADIDDGELREFLATRIARFKIPRYIQVSDALLPRTASEKIYKLHIKQQALAALNIGS